MCLVVWWVFFRPDVLTAVWVYAPNAREGASEFRVEIPNTRVQMTGASNTFKPLVSEQEMLAAMRAAHPGTAVSGSVAEVVEDDQGYVLFPESGAPGVYTLQVEVITLTKGDDSYHLPFPVRSVSAVDDENWTLHSSCDSACLADYYGQFSNVKPAGDAFDIALPSGSFTLRADGPGAYFISGP